MLKVLIKNTTSNLVVFVVKIILTFIMTPILVRNLGNYDYGIWEVVVAVIGYMGMLDIGIRPTASRFAAFYKGKDDQDSLITVYSTTMMLMIMISVCLCICSLSWAYFAPGILAQEPAESSKYSIFLMIIGVRLLFTFPGTIAESFLEGFQKYYIKNVVTLFNSVLGSYCLYMLITPENALVLLAMINTVGLSLKYIIYIYLLTRPDNCGLKFAPSTFSKQTLMEILQFGIKTFIQGVATRISNGSGNIIIAGIYGPAIVIFYAIPAGLARYITNIRMMLTHAFMPLFSDLYARGERDKATVWFLTGSKFVISITSTLTFGIILLGEDFIRLWIGAEYAKQGVYILYILGAYHLINTLNPFASRYLTAVGMHGFLAKMGSVEAIINITLSIILAYILGITGVALGALLPTIVIIPIIMNYTCNVIEINVSIYLRQCIQPLIIPAAALILTITILKKYFYIYNYLLLIGISLTAVSVYMIIFLIASITPEEREYFRSKIHSIIN
jgi:O-antigen/teichoic acid export membrane protein